MNLPFKFLTCFKCSSGGRKGNLYGIEDFREHYAVKHLDGFSTRTCDGCQKSFATSFHCVWHVRRGKCIHAKDKSAKSDVPPLDATKVIRLNMAVSIAFLRYLFVVTEGHLDESSMYFLNQIRLNDEWKHCVADLNINTLALYYNANMGYYNDWLYSSSINMNHYDCEYQNRQEAMLSNQPYPDRDGHTPLDEKSGDIDRSSLAHEPKTEKSDSQTVIDKPSSDSRSLSPEGTDSSTGAVGFCKGLSDTDESMGDVFVGSTIGLLSQIKTCHQRIEDNFREALEGRPILPPQGKVSVDVRRRRLECARRILAARKMDRPEVPMETEKLNMDCLPSNGISANTDDSVDDKCANISAENVLACHSDPDSCMELCSESSLNKVSGGSLDNPITDPSIDIPEKPRENDVLKEESHPDRSLPERYRIERRSIRDTRRCRRYSSSSSSSSTSSYSPRRRRRTVSYGRRRMARSRRSYSRSSSGSRSTRANRSYSRSISPIYDRRRRRSSERSSRDWRYGFIASSSVSSRTYRNSQCNRRRSVSSSRHRTYDISPRRERRSVSSSRRRTYDISPRRERRSVSSSRRRTYDISPRRERRSVSSNGRRTYDISPLRKRRSVSSSARRTHDISPRRERRSPSLKRTPNKSREGRGVGPNKSESKSRRQCKSPDSPGGPPRRFRKLAGRDTTKQLPGVCGNDDDASIFDRNFNLDIACSKSDAAMTSVSTQQCLNIPEQSTPCTSETVPETRSAKAQAMMSKIMNSLSRRAALRPSETVNLEPRSKMLSEIRLYKKCRMIRRVKENYPKKTGRRRVVPVPSQPTFVPEDDESCARLLELGPSEFHADVDYFGILQRGCIPLGCDIQGTDWSSTSLIDELQKMNTVDTCTKNYFDGCFPCFCCCDSLEKKTMDNFNEFVNAGNPRVHRYLEEGTPKTDIAFQDLNIKCEIESSDDEYAQAILKYQTPLCESESDVNQIALPPSTPASVPVKSSDRIPISAHWRERTALDRIDQPQNGAGPLLTPVGPRPHHSLPFRHGWPEQPRNHAELAQPGHPDRRTLSGRKAGYPNSSFYHPYYYADPYYYGAHLDPHGAWHESGQPPF